jgi:stearoyl-CoA desaturase (delta-9 desaturase)
MMFLGMFDLPWWGYTVAALALTHVTIVAVTVFLHRHQAHRALELHPVASHFFRLWLWLTTGMVTREWTAVHRKHHAKCETVEDPHSPRVLGINRVLWRGVFLYVKEANRPDTLQRYGSGTPDDWIERNVYSRYPVVGLTVMGVTDIVLFGAVPGVLIFVTQMMWIPFWAAGVINGIGHRFGYRNWSTPDASVNIVPFGLLIGGEELHNNHHAHPTSARLSNKWYEIDIGWIYIRVLETIGLARIKHLAPTPCFTAAKPIVDVDTLQAIIDCRYDVLARYAKALSRIYAKELDRLRRLSPRDARALLTLKPWLCRDEKSLCEADRIKLAETLLSVRALRIMYSMRSELADVWGRSMATPPQLVKQLQDWCQRAEASGVEELQRFSRQLCTYALLSEPRLPARASRKPRSTSA